MCDTRISKTNRYRTNVPAHRPIECSSVPIAKRSPNSHPARMKLSNHPAQPIPDPARQRDFFRIPPGCPVTQTQHLETLWNRSAGAWFLVLPRRITKRSHSMCEVLKICCACTERGRFGRALGDRRNGGQAVSRTRKARGERTRASRAGYETNPPNLSNLRNVLPLCQRTVLTKRGFRSAFRVSPASCKCLPTGETRATRVGRSHPVFVRDGCLVRRRTSEPKRPGHRGLGRSRRRLPNEANFWKEVLN
jgi:hypothetical protein